MTKQDFKDKYGEIPFTFSYWYKNDLVYIAEEFNLKLVIRPDYRDTLEREETLNSMTFCEDYQSIRLCDVSDGSEWGVRLFEGEGDNV